jgi:hypothetical protein
MAVSAGIHNARRKRALPKGTFAEEENLRLPD